MDQSCFRDAWGYLSTEWSQIELSGTLLIAYFLAIGVAPLVLWAYQRSVERLMTQKGGSERVELFARDSSAPQKPPATNSRTAARESAMLEAISSGMSRQSRLIARTAVLFGTLSFIVLLAASWHYNADDSLARTWWFEQTLFALMLVGGVIAPVVIVRSQLGHKRFWLSVPFAVLLLLIWDDILLDVEMNIPERIADALLGLGIAALVYLSVVGRRLRNVVPLLTLLLFAFVTGLTLYGLLIEASKSCASDRAEILFAVFGFALLCLVTVAANRTLGALADAYERQRFSDSQLQLLLWSIVIALLLAVEATPDDDDVIVSAWGFGVAAAWLVALGSYRARIKGWAPWTKPAPLLMLRVFSSNRATQGLLDAVSGRWSHVGPIHLVGGPDLAKAYLEPHELLLFLRRRLHELFIVDAAGLKRRLGELDTKADPDGCFRINEFYCHDDTWQDAVRALLGEARAIVLDLRGFNDARVGTAFEITLLAQTGAWSRTVLITDDATDVSAVEAILRKFEGASLTSSNIVSASGCDPLTETIEALVAVAARRS